MDRVRNVQRAGLDTGAAPLWPLVSMQQAVPSIRAPATTTASPSCASAALTISADQLTDTT